MNADDLFRTLADRAVELYLDGDRLGFRAPAGALTPELRGNITDHRLAIIAHLRIGGSTDAAASCCKNCDRRNWRDDSTQGRPHPYRVRDVRTIHRLSAHRHKDGLMSSPK